MLSPTPESLVALLADAGLTVAVAESLTGGAVCAVLIEGPGASEVIAGGVVAYTPQVKQSVLGVPAEVIEHHGVVSREVALAMASGVRALFGASVGIATTGAAGPQSHDGAAPGTVCVAAVWEGGEAAWAREHPGDRRAVRAAAVADALEVLRHAVGETPAQPHGGGEQA